MQNEVDLPANNGRPARNLYQHPIRCPPFRLGCVELVRRAQAALLVLLGYHSATDSVNASDLDGVGEGVQ